VDPAFQPLLAVAASPLQAMPTGLTAQMLRASSKQMQNPSLPVAIHATRDIRVSGPAGELAVRLYHPNEGERLPLIVFFHGGGFVLCDLDSHDALCRAPAIPSGCAVAAVWYRLAPETRFPGPLEDCYAALRAL
jgi:acetyl esterase